MAFDPKNYKAPAVKKLPVILLLDVSGSMQGEKIDSLYSSVLEMVDSFAAAQAKETMIDVAIITFGKEVLLHTPYTSVAEIKAKGVERFKAEGATPMGVALRMAKDMIDDKNVTPSHIYRPAVVLVSDGQPNDKWEQPLKDFINDGRSSKCQRFAIAIGEDADKDVLKMFTGAGENVFYAKDAGQLSECFQKFTMSVSTRATSNNPNVIVTNRTDSSSDTSNNSDEMLGADDEYL